MCVCGAHSGHVGNSFARGNHPFHAFPFIPFHSDPNLNASSASEPEGSGPPTTSRPEGDVSPTGEPDEGSSGPHTKPPLAADGSTEEGGGAEKEADGSKKEKDSVVYNIHLSLPGVSQTVDVLVS